MKVVVSTNFGLAYRIKNAACGRWFVTFDGQECPTNPIDAILKRYIKDTYLLEMPGAIRGNCFINKRGPINVQLNVGRCPGFATDEPLTGFRSMTRIYVEELATSQ